MATKHWVLSLLGAMGTLGLILELTTPLLNTPS